MHVKQNIVGIKINISRDVGQEDFPARRATFLTH